MPVVIGAMENVRSGDGGEGESGERGFFLFVHVEGKDNSQRLLEYLKIYMKNPPR